MVPTTVITDSITDLIAADVANLAAAAAKHVHLIMAPFTPGPGTDFTALTPATFTGSTALNAAAGAQQSFQDGATQRRVVQLIEPVGGWHWVTGDAVNLPQTIYGFAVTDLANAVTFGSEVFPTPIVLTAGGQAIDIAQVRFTQSLSPLS